MIALSNATACCTARIESLTRARKRLILLVLDLAATVASLAATLHLLPPAVPLPSVHLAAFAALVPVTSAALGLHRIKLAAFGGDGALRVAGLALVATLALHALTRLGGHPLGGLPLLLFALIAVVSLVGARMTLLHLFLALLRHGRPRSPVVIYGAGETGLQLAAALRRHDGIRPVAFLDDNPLLAGMTVSGLRVFPAATLPRLIETHDVVRVILAMPGVPKAHQARLALELQARGLQVQTVPSFARLVGQDALADRLQPVSTARFLGRPAILGTGADDRAYTGKSLMVTGAGGTIGAELCRQLAACNPRELMLIDLSEAALYTIDKDLRRDHPAIRIVPVIGSVTDAALLRGTLDRHRIDAIFHAAAYKHVPLVESNPVIGIKNNVLGTRALAEAADQAGVARFILISTDKAVRPGNVMGATKRLAELTVQDVASRARSTQFSIVRFGNVLGSSGSVVPLFREQIARGGPVTLTHADVTRYFMTIEEAAHLVLTVGGFSGDGRAGADVFVLDMGHPRRIRDLALQMIEAAGYRLRDASNPQGDIEIQEIGLRPGEKLHEELVLDHDLRPTAHPKILRAAEAGLSEFEVAHMLQRLRAVVAMQDADMARALVFRWVEPARAAPRAGTASGAGTCATPPHFPQPCSADH